MSGTMEMTLQREPSVEGTTFGEWCIEGVHECLTLEDQIREVPGQPVIEWKVPKETAIPSGRYRITLELSPRFGPDTLTVNRVPGFEGVRCHGGTTIADTEGCIILGDRLDRDKMTIAGARTDHVLDRMKDKIREAIAAGQTCWLTITNPPEAPGT